MGFQPYDVNTLTVLNMNIIAVNFFTLYYLMIRHMNKVMLHGGSLNYANIMQ